MIQRRESQRRRSGTSTTGRVADRSLYVFTEGRRTEPDYINHWFRKHRDQVVVTIDGFHGTPLRLVEEAIKQRKQDMRDQERGRGRVADEYWCVFDRDEHDDFDDAVMAAAAQDIKIAYSNPCIELWFVLHFEGGTGWIHRSKVQKDSKRLLKCDKHLSQQALELLDDGFGDAKHRALHLDSWHAGNGSPPRSNPSTSVWRLIDRISDS